MAPRPLAFLLVTTLLACLAFPSAAQITSAPNPTELLRASAKNFSTATQFSSTLVIATKVVKGEEQSGMQQVFELRMAAPNRFAVNMLKPMPEFWVHSDGQKIVTYVEPLGRFAVTDQQDGVSAFAASEIASRLGNGFGKVIFGLLDTESTEGVISAITDAEYIGVETVEGESRSRCRYVSGDITWDAWFTTGEQPMLWRVSPDLSPMVAGSPAAQRYDNFSLTVNLTLRDIDLEERLADDAFATATPAGAKQVAIEDLFAPPPQPPHELLSQKAPIFDTTNLAGEPIALGDVLGKKIIILDFWATWCGPCVAALPKITEVAGEYESKGVAFYAVNQGEDAETITQFMTDRELTFPVVMDPESDAAGAYFVERLPTSVIIGKDGRVQVVHVGFSPELDKSLREELDALLAGEDLAAKTIAKWNEENPDQKIGEAEE